MKTRVENAMGYTNEIPTLMSPKTKKREVEKYEQAMKAERQRLEIVGPDDI